MKKGIRKLYSFSPKTDFKAYVQTCGFLMRACSRGKLIKEGRVLHGHVIKKGISIHRFIFIKLLIIYLKGNDIYEGEKLFEEIDGFCLTSWNCMISARVDSGRFDQALELFDEMPERNAVTWTTLIAGFMKFGRVEESIWYFERDPFRTVFSWTSFISGLVQNGLNAEALISFRRMVKSEIMPNEYTFTSVVRACLAMDNFIFCKAILTFIIKTGNDRNLSVSNSLITMHLKMGEDEIAQRIFDEMDERDVISWTALLDVYVERGEMKECRFIFDNMPNKTVITWSTMMARYSQNGEANEAMKLFHEMLHDGLKPNVSCYSTALCASSTLEALQLGENIHGNVIKVGIDGDVYIASPIIDMYCKCGRVVYARRVFDLLSKKNIVCWNSMIVGYSYNGQMDEARELFSHMPTRNVVSWSALIAGLTQNELCEEALQVFDEMLLSGAIPNDTTFSSVLRACSSLASLEKGKNFHGRIIKMGIQYLGYMGTALTDLYAKCGDIESSKKVFDRMIEKNEISWTVIIQGLADNGLSEESIFQFNQMLKAAVIPTELTFLAVLFACSHCGLVEKGFEYFNLMKEVYGITPKGKHYTSMVDLLARSGRLVEAENFIKSMPFKPEVNAWSSLLSACSIHGNREIGERSASNLWELERENPAGYVLLSNIYASMGRWCEVAKVRKQMKECGSKKVVSCSWIQVRNQTHTFYVGDECYHPQSWEIHKTLDLLRLEMMMRRGHHHHQSFSPTILRSAT